MTTIHHCTRSALRCIRSCSKINRVLYELANHQDILNIFINIIRNVEDDVNDDVTNDFESHDSMSDIMYIFRRLITEDETYDKVAAEFPQIPAVIIFRCT